MNVIASLKLHSDDSFETALNKLEQIVSVLDEGKLSLDEMLALYEEGIKIYRYCHKKLDCAEQKITIILGDTEVPFDFRDFTVTKEG